MATNRAPLCSSITARAGSLTKDAVMENCFQETRGQDQWATKRPGISTLRSLGAGAGSGVYSWQGHDYAVVGTSLFKDGSSLGTVNGVGGIYQFSHTQDNQTLCLKNTKAAYTVNLAGTITHVVDANYPATTVPGLVYLDGTFYVMDNTGAIFGSNIEDFTTWNALNVIRLSVDPNTPVALVKQMNYVYAFSLTAVEVFYDAGNATGSPLGRYDSLYLPMGCAAAGAVCGFEGSLYFVSRSAKSGRSVYVIQGTQVKKISTPFVDSILDADAFNTVYSFCIRIRGQAFYVLSLAGSNITLVCNPEDGAWVTWSATTAQSTFTPLSLSWSGNVVTANITAHGLSDGAIIAVAGMTPSGYNGNFLVSVLDANNIQYPVYTTSLANASVIGTVKSYTTGYFPYVAYEDNAGSNILQHVSSGDIATMAVGTYQDDGLPIQFRCRTGLIDGGTNNKKFFSGIDLVGDAVSSVMYMRRTDDDYQTYSNFQPVNMSLKKARWHRNGSSRRRAFEFVHVDNTDCHVQAVEYSIGSGPT